MKFILGLGLCGLLLLFACKNESHWIPQPNESNIHWRLATEEGYDFNKVYMDSAGNTWALSNAGIVRYREKGGTWTTERLPIKGVGLFCIGGRGDEVWIGGENLTILYKKKGRPWVLQKSAGSPVDLRCIHVSKNDVYMAGNWNTILHKRGNGDWVREKENNKDVMLHSISGTPNDLYIIGSPATVWHKKNKGWVQDSIPVAINSLTSVHISPNDVFICGDSGLILHKSNKGLWLREKTPINKERIIGIHGWDDHLWAVGLNGSILYKRRNSNWIIDTCINNIFASSYSRGHNIWIGGFRGAIVHKNENSSWQHDSTHKPNGLIYDIGGNETEVAAVGFPGTCFYLDANNLWKETPSLIDYTPLTGVYADADDIWVSNIEGKLFHKKGEDEWQAEETGIKNFKLAGGYRFGNECWLIGQPGTILYKKGNRPWQRQVPGLKNNELNGIYGYKDELWVVGSNNIVLHKKSGSNTWLSDHASKKLNFYKDLIGIGDDLWAVGDHGAIIHKKLHDSGWKQQPIDPAITNNKLHLHAIRKQGNVLWAVGTNGTILYKKSDESWKKLDVRKPLAHFKCLVTDDSSVCVAGFAEGKGIIVQIRDETKFTVETIPDINPLNLIRHKGIFILTKNGYLHLQHGKTGFIQKSLTSSLNKEMVGAAVKDSTLYLISNHAITALLPSDKQYPVLHQVRYFRNSWFNRDSLELQFKIRFPAREKAMDLRHLQFSIFAKPWHELPESGGEFVFVNPRVQFIDTTGNEFVASLRFEIADAFQIIPSSENANKLMVRLQIDAPIIGVSESFILKDAAGNSFLTIQPFRINLTYWQKFFISLFLLFLLPYLLCWYFKPLYFLQIHNSRFFDQLGRVPKFVHTIFTLNGLPYSKHVQQAWLKKYKKSLIKAFYHNGVVEIKGNYISLPVTLDGEQIEKPNAKLLYKINGPVVQIVGQGGAGKTTLAIAIGKWMIEKKQSIPILIDCETTNLIKTICDHFKAQLDLDQISAPLITAMLQKRRLQVIIDGLSERSTDMQEHILTSAIPALITTRYAFKLESKHLYISALSSKNLMHFITTDLSGRSDHPVKTWRQQIAFARSIVQLFKRNNMLSAITPILVKLIIDNANANEAIPVYIAQVYYQYLARVQPQSINAKNYLHDFQVVEVAEQLAKLSLAQDFIPRDFKERDAQKIFAGNPQYKGIDPIQRFIDNGIITRYTKSAVYLRFNLDTLAEYIGASRLYDENQHQLDSLHQQIEQLGNEAEGFKIAFEQVKAYKMRATSPYPTPS